MSKFGVQGKVKVVNGHVVSPIHSGLRLIVNFCGVDGKYDHPVDKAISRIWKGALSDYRTWFVTQQKFKLGEIKETIVNSDIFVVNLLVRDKTGQVDPIALESAVKKLATFAQYEKGSVHLDNSLLVEAPKLEELLVTQVLPAGVNVYLYKQPELETAQ